MNVKDVLVALQERLQEAKKMKAVLDQTDAPYVTLRWRYGYYDGKIRTLEDLISDLRSNSL